MSAARLMFERGSGNSYFLKDGVIEADVELLGGGDGMLIVLHSIKECAPQTGTTKAGTQELIDYLAEQVQQQKKLGDFVILHKGVVAFSLSKELRRGDTISTRIKQIRQPEV